MAMGTERSSRALHNFTMPGDLRWGNQRFLRCMKVNSDGEISTMRRVTNNQHNFNHNRNRNHNRNSSPIEHNKDSSSGGSHRDSLHGLDSIREKSILDLQTAANRMKDAILKEALEEGEIATAVAPPPPPPEGGETSSRPWNLRTRRAACKTTPLSVAAAGDYGGGKVISPMRPAADKLTALRSGGAEEKTERRKFAVALTRREIEEDFLAMVSHRPPRRPKKRARGIQKEMDTLFPGLWLTEVTADMYKVVEPAP